MENKFYITSSIAYTNAPPHIGFALELVQADVLARYHKLLGEDVFFLTGTDEHGQKIVRAAEYASKTPEKFTDDISEKFRKLTQVLNLSNNDFIRTTDKKRHWPSVQKAWKTLENNGDIYKKKYQGLYCVGCEAFIKEKDLVDGKCSNHQQKPELIEEENYFFKLSKYAGQVKEKIESGELQIIPEGRKNEILSFISQGIEDISCSRARENLKWGVPIPGDENQIIYIWFEALINYISALGYEKNSAKFKKYWPADVHCIGKDIFRFHALLWPAMLLSLGLDLPKTIFVHGYLTSDGQKMSKSLGNVIDPFELVKKYGVDPVRYFLLREIPPTEDGDFSYEKFENRYNSDLASGLGNLTSRIVKMAGNLKIKKDIGISEEVSIIAEKTFIGYEDSLSKLRFNEALSIIWELIGWCDRYIEKEKPWETKDERVISNLLFVLASVARLIKPFLPETSENILKQIKNKDPRPLFPRF